MIQRATIEDSVSIFKLIEQYASEDIMIKRALSDIYDNIQKFYTVKNNIGDVIGCASLQTCWTGNNGTVIGEIRSMAVSFVNQKQGHGKALINYIANEARLLKLSKLFVLTNSQGIFEKYGFVKTSIDGIPGRRIWTDCFNCPKFPPASSACNEIPMVLFL